VRAWAGEGRGKVKVENKRARKWSMQVFRAMRMVVVLNQHRKGNASRERVTQPFARIQQWVGGLRG